MLKKKKNYRNIKRRMTDENEHNEGKYQRKFITERERKRERDSEGRVSTRFAN